MTHELDELAQRYKIATRYKGLDGVEHDVPDDTKRAILTALGVDASSDESISAALTGAPAAQEDSTEVNDLACFVPHWLEEQGCWGVTIQVYALRSARNWGMGDFADLAAVAKLAAEAGADFLGTNPLHAMFPFEPERRSPFFPSSRRFLNPLYVAVDEVPGFSPSMVKHEALEAVRRAELIDYAGVARLKLAALRQVWDAWKDQNVTHPDYAPAAFDAFVAAEGEALRRHALFDAISEVLAEQGLTGGWMGWPEHLRHVESDEVAEFATEHADKIDFYCWLQWLASVQLRAAQQTARDAGMRIGLYLDLAVGEAPDGSASWGAPHRTLRGVQIGAPPDYFSSTGQDWAIAPISPTALRSEPEATFGEMIVGSMRYCGALRIDHAMALKQLFLIPSGAPPAAGSYVQYPTRRMLEALSYASHAHQSIVIGEDLGYVPPGFRDMMAAVRLFSYRILYFERHDDGFVAPEHYPAWALACIGTHDLPTIEGWWRGADVALRLEHRLIEAEAAEHQTRLRQAEREQIVELLVRTGLLDDGQRASALAAADSADPLPDFLVIALHRFLARTSSRLCAVRLEDLLGDTEPVNLPGTVDDYPNWKRKYEVPVEEIGDQSRFVALTEAMASERPRSSSPQAMESLAK